MIKKIKKALGCMMCAISRERDLAQAGCGGGGGFAGIGDDWKNQYKTGGILLGRSLNDPSCRVGLEPERHLITVASAGAGKTSTRTLTNLLLWPGSAVVVDIKGTHAAVTGYARGHGGGRVRRGMGQDVKVLNPFGVNAGRPGMPPSCRFNPLSTVDINANTVYEDIDTIAEGLIVPDARGGDHWDVSARALIRGLIGHVLSADNVEARTLVEVRRLLTRPDGPPLAEMAANEACGGLIREAASQMLVASEKEFSGILSTAIQQTGWLASRAMQEMLSGSDFDLMDLKRKRTTLYLVIPPEYLATHGRFLRLFINLCLKVATRGGASGVPLLFVMDEFYSLGRLDSMAAAAANVRSYGITLWPIVHNLGQIRELYRDNWETFLSNAGAIEVFGVNDLTTARYGSDMLGRFIVTADDGRGHMVRVAAAPLRDAAELVHELDPRGERMVVYRGGPRPLLVRRLAYHRIFAKGQYNPDPDIKGS